MSHRPEDKSINSLITKLGCDEKETRFKNTKSASHGYSVEILDFQCLNFVFFMVYRDFEQVAIFTLKEEEKSALNGVHSEQGNLE